MSSDPIQTATRLFEAGRFGEAAQLCERVLAMRPTHAPALSLAGLIALRGGDYDAALRRLSLAASVDARNANHHFNVGEALSALGRLPDAVEAYRRALRLNPKHAAAENGLGFTLQAMGDMPAALAAFTRAASLDRRAPAIQINLGAALQAVGRTAEAIAALRQAVALAPGMADAHYNLGRALAASGELEAAAACYGDALARAPDHVRAMVNLGLVRQQQGDTAAALALFEQACERAPAFADAWFNRANALKELDRFDDALAALDCTLAIDPAHRQARKNRGLVRLTRGEFAGGWLDYLARERPASPPTPSERLPGDLSGQTLLLMREQGVGDELFFLRFAPALAARGATFTAVVDPRLEGMLGRAGLRVVAEAAKAGTTDRQLLIGDLPFLLDHHDAAGCPRPLAIPPLDASAARARARLAEAGPKPRIAVTWRAGLPGNARQLAPDRLGATLAGLAASVVVVQRKPVGGEIEAFRAGLGRAAADMTDVNDDLEHMLALMSEVDLYVAVSNTNVHLRASAGRSTHVLVPNPPEWRWMADAPTSPWFPDCPTYRQSADGDWSAALAKLARDLGH